MSIIASSSPIFFTTWGVQAFQLNESPSPNSAVSSLRLNWQAQSVDSVDAWAESFDNWLQSKLETWDLNALYDYRESAPYAHESVPTNEHFIPLLLTMGTGDMDRQAKLLHRSYRYGNLSLSCWQFN
jgi:4,5-DOPA dioxygenase extradiol